MFSGAAPTTDPAGPDRVLRQLRDDEKFTANELVNVLIHCAAISASADYRTLQAAALIHDEYAEQYGAAVAEAVGDVRAESVEDLYRRAADARERRRALGPDGLEQAIAAVGAALTIPPGRARELITAGSVMRYLLPRTGATLARGRIDLPRFLLIVQRTAVCDESLMPFLDNALASEIAAREPMSLVRFRALVDTIVARIDAEAARRRREAAESERHITIRPDRRTEGGSRITGSLPTHQAAAVDARLEAMAAGVHPADPRTRRQRRADAMVALTNGDPSLTCCCPACAPDSDSPPSDSPPSTNDSGTHHPGRTPSGGPAGVPCPRPTFHIIVALETLLGADHRPALLDGHGLIDADLARDLLAEAQRSYVHAPGYTRSRSAAPYADPLASPHPPAPRSGEPPPDGLQDTYAPSRSLRGLVSAGELCCTFPGCTTAVYACDLDHTKPHRQGGRTGRENLKPLCRLHHRVKTFTPGWRDYQDPLQRVFFETPTGHVYLGNAFTGYDMFTELRPRPPDRAHPAYTHVSKLRTRKGEKHRRGLRQWDDAHPPPF